ncbi:MAG: DUF5320 domain-containing protein [Desulfobacterales bacterium]|jgi:hypothetical protein|nr:DUF5320 domain-containing protein [Desulfobacteraceae bacterium]MBT4365381.1 DUF5320 domain-containing protein [Desulfobacteraceae bacterium]MBT7697769.1 DUF5320 domain-containing protein [Desulfobacterales bacterium]
MPGLNGTGPMGSGPMTGGGRGRCNPANQGFAGQSSVISAGFSRGFGSGRGSRRGSGMGMRRGFGRDSFNEDASSAGITEDELSMFKSETSTIKVMLETINRKITELEKAL